MEECVREPDGRSEHEGAYRGDGAKRDGIRSGLPDTEDPDGAEYASTGIDMRRDAGFSRVFDPSAYWRKKRPTGKSSAPKMCEG